jgi:DNA processing protein
MITADPKLTIQTLDIADSSELTYQFAGVLPAVETLYYVCDDISEIFKRPRVAIVGTRKVTPYGRYVTEMIAGELARLGVVIVSGLAYGVDEIAHTAALEAGGLTAAVLPGPVSDIYPRGHEQLGRRIVEEGGALISEYPSGSQITYKSQFVERNRIVAGMSDVLIITEAAQKSGTLHTARFAREQGRTVFAVPGNITSISSAGANHLLSEGASVLTHINDVVHALGFRAAVKPARPKGDSPSEQAILDLINTDVRDGHLLLERTRLGVSEFNQALTMLELTGKIRALGSNQWGLR